MNSDTISLLQKCDAGCKNATNSMEQVMGFVQDNNLKNVISDYNQKHIKIGNQCHSLLDKYGSNEKDPQLMTRAMTFMSTEIKMMTGDTNKKAAEIMVDGCNMGIKTVSGYINQYSNANNESLQMANKIVKTEQDFIEELRDFL